ncbi:MULTISPECIES: hypothetical protein [Chryseobacterium]|jgi:hypothetical protein|uniref:Uncharacterized protein n=2 Tax=Chryseobacterium TaxID=59732 RepID=A0AAJ1VLB2_9FLAO|nr:MULTISPECIES: hypothetical protein [Chryseobacterium]MCF2219885.1 hypothetical protein [Chryseobacterium sp. PS-8]MDN4013966.1 hypothetical protein [Chryseobacterium gambrini]MDN4031562.1 hypothetical protein [Chryseobacterium gambrini]QWA38352.1 hypothetical protein KKI44_21165 [Chryseobacterium sp. ZHDP1]
MKQFYKSKSLLRLSFLFAVLFSAILVVNSCKKDDEDGFTDHIIQFEAKINTKGPNPPANPPVTGTFKTVVTQIGTGQSTTFNPTGTTWSSGEQFVSSSQAQLNLAANAVLPYSDSELIINIYVDGEVAKTKKVVGSGTQSASLSYSFLEL